MDPKQRAMAERRPSRSLSDARAQAQEAIEIVRHRLGPMLALPLQDVEGALDELVAEVERLAEQNMDLMAEMEGKG